MLNERFEVSEYMYDVKNTNPRPERIKRSILLWQNDLLGLERFMIMLARFFIFEDGAGYEEGLKRADAAIRMWCGHAPEKRSEDRLADQYEYLQENYPWLDYWLINYLRETVSCEDEQAMERVENGLRALENKKPGFSVSSLNKQAKENDFKAIRYDKIIANAAVSRGPLKRYYLACADPEWDINIHGKDDKNLTDGQHDRILKTIAAYMLERSLKQRHDDAPRFELINYMDITFWAVGNRKLYRGDYSSFAIADRPLFSFQKGMSGNAAKVKPDYDWFKSCGWKLIDATENDSALDDFLDNNPEAIFFSDSGGSKPLDLNVRYIR